jgi:dTDP-glucose 4,6-dehydratase
MTTGIGNVLVHGAAGFVAKSLLSRLVDEAPATLIAMDRRPLQEGPARAGNTNTSYTVHQGECLKGAACGSRLDLVISLAGVTDVDYAIQHPAAAFSGNLDIAMELGEWLRTEQPQARLIYLSSDEVLGPSAAALGEDAPHRPTQPYAASKAAAETVLHAYRDVYGLDVVTLRSCNLVGGRQRARKLIPVTVQSLVRGEPVPVYGTGRQKREWMAVEDLCSAILRLADRTVSPGIYQAASGVHLDVLQVVELVAEALGRAPVTRSAPDRLVHDVCYAMRSDRLRTLGWGPATDPAAAITYAARELAQAAIDGQVIAPDYSTV